MKYYDKLIFELSESGRCGFSLRESAREVELPDALKPGGRVAILTFHSGEDKLVKRALKEGFREGIYSDYSKDVIRPSAQECAQNGRARSTKMRWAVRA